MKEIKPRKLNEYTLCDDCPCMNMDIENGEECNLFFTIELLPVANGEATYASTDCKLHSIIIEDKETPEFDRESFPVT